MKLILLIAMSVLCLSFFIEDKRIKISGYVTGGGELQDSVEVVIFDNNCEVGQYYTDFEGSFDYELERNKYYTIEYRKSNFFLKRIIIDTGLGENIGSKEFLVEFSVDLILVKSLEGVEADVLDFPVTRFTYDYDSKEFEYELEFVENRYKEIQELFDIKKKHDKREEKRSQKKGKK